MTAPTRSGPVRRWLPGIASLLLVACTQGLGIENANARERVIYDEDAEAQISQFDRISEQSGAAYQSSAGLRVEPTKWHTPFFRIADGRTDFRVYSTLSFQIRSTAGSIEPSIVLWDDARGTEVSIAQYANGGRVDETWREVRIPTSALASDAFPLDSVYLIGFGPMDDPQPFDIDNVTLHDDREPAIQGWKPLSNRAIAVFFDDLDHDALGPASAFAIRSDSDPAYAEATPPEAVGSSRRAVEISDTGLGVESRSTLYLLLPRGLRAGNRYQLSLEGVRGASGRPMSDPTLSFVYQAPAVSPSIKLNQVGYARHATKLVFVGNWLGDAGPMPVDGLAFDVVDTRTGTVVYSGDLALRTADDVESGEDVYTGDFSAVNTAGEYRISVPTLGSSYRFEIRDDIYDPVYRATMRVFYHRRNTAITAPYAEPGFERAGIDPSLSALFHPILADYPLSRGETPFAFKPIQAGWYDAGDYGQYIHNAAPVWALIGLALDLAAPGQFKDGELGIPESGNGIPDILDELSYGMAWALSMQDIDGGVYWRVTPAEWDLVAPGDVSEPRYLYEKTTRATAQFAAMGAIYSRLILPYHAATAEHVLQAARNAWEYTQSNPAYPAEGTYYRNPEALPGGGEYSSNSAKPDLLWAAAELYRTTGDLDFQDRYRTLLDEVSIDVTAAPFSTFAQWALIKATHPTRDALLLEQARRLVMRGADIKRERALASSYRSPKHPHIPFTGWSNFSASPMWSLALLQGHYLSGLALYEDLAWQVVDIMLGANPLSQVWLTGIGDNPVQDPLDRALLNDDTDAVIPGIPVPGATWHLNGWREPFSSVNAAYFPPGQPSVADDYASAYPVFRRYIDSHHLIPMNESTVREMAAVAAAFGLMRNAALDAPIQDPVYAWTPGEAASTTIYRLDDIPVADVPAVPPAQITAFGAEAVLASQDRLAALTPEQIAAIDAPTTPYWVERLSPSQRLALTAAQIQRFQEWSLFTALPAALVPAIPAAKMPSIGLNLRSTSAAWKAAVTPAQREAMTSEQRAILDAG